MTTTVSTKGQVILPKALREARHWSAGTRLVVEESDAGIVLRPDAAIFQSTRPEDVFGMLAVSGNAKSLEEMDAAITEEVRDRHARDRY
ncbi:MAG: AbrB/MazE/SpoVT family DNA-binding domain-containing protein [Gluconobacter potus]|nr:MULTISPECIES: AbrB/MazE/SpoVT family DNA-binding domain-containing protein [Acetobacteraceae]WEQ54961.1 AbrB/MazE/SpoVT family DNA-binding domain-containing protein [Komagataeibacter nataicola]